MVERLVSHLQHNKSSHIYKYSDWLDPFAGNLSTWEACTAHKSLRYILQPCIDGDSRSSHHVSVRCCQLSYTLVYRVGEEYSIPRDRACSRSIMWEWRLLALQRVEDWRGWWKACFWQLYRSWAARSKTVVLLFEETRWDENRDSLKGLTFWAAATCTSRYT